MAGIDSQMKQKLEHLFEMHTGCVLDFSNDSLATSAHHRANGADRSGGQRWMILSGSDERADKIRAR